MRTALGTLLGVLAAGVLAAVAAVPAGAEDLGNLGPAFSSSAISTPASGSELFYDGDSGAGSITVRGTVSPALPGARGDLQCYSTADNLPLDLPLAGGIDVSSGSFAVSVSLAKAAGQACRLAFVPAGGDPAGPAAAPFTGPAISVSYQDSHASHGNLFNFYVVSGTLPFSYALGSVGATVTSCPSGAEAPQCSCPIINSFATEPVSLGTWPLFTGNACLPQSAGIRSALMIDGRNAYAPASLATLPSVQNGFLSGAAGFEPLSYSTGFGAAHDTVTVADTETPMVCDAPGGFPPTLASCPALHVSGVQVQQTSSVLPGGQVARVEQRFTSVDGAPHAIDALFSQSVSAPPRTTAEPGFQFPGETGAVHRGPPASFAGFPAGPGSIIVISDPTREAGPSNPVGSISYGRPPLSANFIPSANPGTSTFVMRYADTIPAGGSVVYDWSFTQATSLLGMQSLERVERDRFSIPVVRILSPRNRSTSHTRRVTIRGAVADPVGVAALRINGVPVAGTPTGAFSVGMRMKPGVNKITAVVTNLAGNSAATTMTVTYRPRACQVPKLSGRTLSSARSALRRAGCKLGRVRHRASTKIRRGRVIASTPRAGARRKSGSPIALSLSNGAPAARGRR